MSPKELSKRYFLFLIAVMLQSCAIACITYADIGTTPVSSANYVFSLHSDYTFGETTLMFNILLIVLQIMFIAIGHDSFKNHWLNILVQVPFVVVFSYMIDVATFLLSMIVPEEHGYMISWVLVILGTLTLSFSISLSVVANVAMLSGEYFVKVFHPLINRSFSFVKTFFDIFLVSSACIFSLIFTDFTAVEGVREGTLYGALLTGPTVHLIVPHLGRLKRFLEDKKDAGHA